MTDFLKVTINSKELKFLTGIEMPYSLYAKLLSKGVYTESTERQLNAMKFLVSDIIKTKILPLTYSNDPRYDKKEPIMFAVNQIREKGLNRQMREKILSDKYCISKQRLSAEYFILNSVLTDIQLDELMGQLRSKLDYHTQKSDDLMGGVLPDFINFSPKSVLLNSADLKAKKKTL